MIKNIVILLMFFPMIYFSQSNNTINVDSIRLEQKYHLLLDGKDNIILPLSSFIEIIDPYSPPFEVNFIDDSNNNITELNSFVLNRIKSDMHQTFEIYRKGQNKYHLGVVSDVLGYVGTAAAAGLAAYHVYKYKKKYGIK